MIRRKGTMKNLKDRISPVEVAVRPEPTRTISRLPYRFAAWVLGNHAERWGRRALFYKRHRDYFPRLSSGGFIARCRELEATYRGLSLAIWNMTPQVAWVPVRSGIRRIR
jgi:hypothetical protein